MRRLSFIAIVLTCLVRSAFAVEASREGPPRNIILIGWDGAQRGHVLEAYNRGELPNLKQLVAEGAMKEIQVTAGATDTKAGWVQILTGLHPRVTGTYSNGRFRDVPAGYSVFERLREHFGAENITTAAVIGKRYHCGEVDSPSKKPLNAPQPQAKAGKKKAAKAAERNKPPTLEKQPGANPAKERRGRIVEENGVKYVVYDGSPYYTMHNNVNAWFFGLVQDAAVGDKALQLLDQYKDKRFFLFVHFAEVDHDGHRHGENSKPYNDALISNDRQTGRIVAKLKELGLYEKTIIYVTADHGFNEDAKNHRSAPHVFIGTNDPKVMRNGDRLDITPTVLDRFGVDIAKLNPPLDGQPLTQPATIVRQADGTTVKQPAQKKTGAAQKAGDKKRK